MKRFDAIMAAPWGRVGIRTSDAAVTAIFYLPPGAGLQPASEPLAAEAVRQIEAYLRDPDHRFDLPLALQATSFRRQVWDAICAIPRGGTATYGDIARRVQAMPQAVGQACGDNPFPIVIPCHRVVGRNSLGGFAHDRESAAGFHSEVKRWLLVHEGALLL
jgi:methylated-DNA-[protein]-cysteine S-methyltransferase